MVVATRLLEVGIIVTSTLSVRRRNQILEHDVKNTTSSSGDAQSTRSSLRGTFLVLILFLALTLVAVIFCNIVIGFVGRDTPDRVNVIQGPLALLVLAAPALAFALRRRSRPTRVGVLVLQLLLYVLYESGISIQTNIRIDLLLIAPALALTAVIVLQRSSSGVMKNE